MADLPLAPFGRTGHDSTRLIFGAAALGSMRPERATETLDFVAAVGINHIDTAASYGDSEDRLQPWLADHRHEVFLATKTGERTGVAARRELERSLQRLGVEQVDLIQMHNLVEDDEFEIAFGPDGVYRALEQARADGLVRFIGVTGHGLRIAGMHLRSLERADLDSVLLPFNHSLLSFDAYRRDVQRLLEVCAERQVAVQTIKSIARRRWSEHGDDARYSWYEPLTDTAAIDRAVRWVLGHDGLFVNTTSDARLLPAVVEAARRFAQMEAESAAAGFLAGPELEAQLEADEDAFSIRPLFDGAELERI